MRFIRNSAWIFCLVVLVGCAGVAPLPDGPTPVATSVRDQMGRLAVRAPGKPTVMLAADLDNKGKAAATTAAAAGLGWLGGTMEAAGQSGDPWGGMFILTLGVVTTPIVAAGGAVYGAAVADTKEDIAAGNRVLEDALDVVPERLQNRLERSFQDSAVHDKVPYVFVSHEVGNEELLSEGFDSVLDVAMHDLRSYPSSNNYEVRFGAENTASLMTLHDGRVLESRRYDLRTGDGSISSWARDNGETLLREIESQYAGAASELVNEFFAAHAIRIQGLAPISKGWGRRGRIADLHPRFEWSALDGSSPAPEGKVEYELRVHLKGEETSVRTRTTTMGFSPSEPLQECQAYRWSVRAHYRSFGQLVATPWTPEYGFKTPCNR